MNPLAAMFGRNHTVNQPQRTTPMDMMQQFNEFRNSFQGDPKQAVMNLIASGKMSQQQFDQLSQMAKLFQNRR